MLGFINLKTAKGKTNGAVKNHAATIQGLIAKGAPYKVEVTDSLLTITCEGFVEKPFNLDGEDAKVRLQQEVIKTGKMISYKTGVVKGGLLLRGTYACQALEAVARGASAFICHKDNPTLKAPTKPSIMEGFADAPIADLDL